MKKEGENCPKSPKHRPHQALEQLLLQDKAQGGKHQAGGAGISGAYLKGKPGKSPAGKQEKSAIGQPGKTAAWGTQKIVANAQHDPQKKGHPEVAKGSSNHPSKRRSQLPPCRGSV